MLSNYKKTIDALNIHNILKSSINVIIAEKKKVFEKNIVKIMVNNQTKYFLGKINLMTNTSFYLYRNLIEMLNCKLVQNKNKNTQNFIIASLQNNSMVMIKQVIKQKKEKSKLEYFPNINWLERENAEKNFFVYFGHNDMRSLLNDYGLFNLDISITNK